MKFDDILMICRERNGMKSWEELAWFLGMTEDGLRQIRKGTGGALKEKTLEGIMRGSSLEAPLIVATWETEHGKNPHVRESWQRLLYALNQINESENGKDSGKLENLCIMLSQASDWPNGFREEFQAPRPVLKQSPVLEFSPMGIRTGVTWTRPEEKTAPGAPWHGPERRRNHRGPWTGPERRTA